MRLVRALIVCCALAFLLPARAVAAPPQQTVDCDIVGSLPPWLREWGQSTGLSPKWVENVDVPLDRMTLQLRVCAPSDKSVEAKQALNLLVDALPLLQRHAGPALGGPLYRRILFVPPQQFPPDLDGMLDENGVMRLMPISQDSTVVHEGAHYWANFEHFQDWWMVEGYAEYLTEGVMDELGQREPIGRPSPACDQVALLDWINEPPDRNRCGYTVGAAVFRDLAQATSTEQLNRALHDLSAGGRKIDSYSLLTELERASGKDLTPLMQRRVFPARWDAALDHRRWLIQELAQATALAGPLGLQLPANLRAAIDDLGSNYASAWLSQLVPLLSSAGAIEQHCRQISPPCVRPWASLPARAEDLGPLVAWLEAAEPMLAQAVQLQTTAQDLGLALPEPLRRRVAALDPAAAGDVLQAAQVLSMGRALDARCGALVAPCGKGWRALWSNSELTSAERAIANLNELLNSAVAIEQRCAEMVTACRDVWHPELKRGNLTAARQALGTLEQTFSRAGLIEQRCDTTRDACHAAWAGAFQSGHVAGARHALNSIDNLLQHARDLEQQCRQASWPCDETWRAAFRKNGDIQSAHAAIAEMRRALPLLLQAARAAEPVLANRRDGPAQQPISNRAAASVGAARQALAQGDIGRALALAKQAIEAKEREEWLALWTPRIYMASILGSCGVLLWILASIHLRRRGARRPMSNDDLLAALLAKPPGRSGRR
jgi:hypothetical protein